MLYALYYNYAYALKLIASVFGVICGLYGLMVGFLGAWYIENPHWVWRIFGIYAVILGLLYMIPNRRFYTDDQVHYY